MIVLFFLNSKHMWLIDRLSLVSSRHTIRLTIKIVVTFQLNTFRTYSNCVFGVDMSSEYCTTMLTVFSNEMLVNCNPISYETIGRQFELNRFEHVSKLSIYFKTRFRVNHVYNCSHGYIRFIQLSLGYTWSTWFEFILYCTMNYRKF